MRFFFAGSCPTLVAQLVVVATKYPPAPLRLCLASADMTAAGCFHHQTLASMSMQELPRSVSRSRYCYLGSQVRFEIEQVLCVVFVFVLLCARE